MSGYACYLERPVLLWQHEIAPCPAEKKSTGQGAATKMARVQALEHNQITDCALMDMHGC